MENSLKKPHLAGGIGTHVQILTCLGKPLFDMQANLLSDQTVDGPCVGGFIGTSLTDEEPLTPLWGGIRRRGGGSILWCVRFQKITGGIKPRITRISRIRVFSRKDAKPQSFSESRNPDFWQNGILEIATRTPHLRGPCAAMVWSAAGRGGARHAAHGTGKAKPVPSRIMRRTGPDEGRSAVDTAPSAP